MFSGAAYAILPYLTIHMKDIGISDIDVALIYTILPFCVFIAPPIVGFFADKLGNYTSVLMVNFVMVGVFHTLLLFVRHTVVRANYPSMNATILDGSVKLNWNACDFVNSSACDINQDPTNKVKLSFSNCSLVCENNNQEAAIPVEEQICNLMEGALCKPNPVRKHINLKGLLPNITQTGCRAATLDLYTTSDPCEGASSQFSEIHLPQGCQANCSARTNMIG